MKRNKILDSGQIKRKFERMARQLLEVHYNEKELILLGVHGNGIEVAKRLEAILNKIGKMPVRLESIKLNKKKPLDSDIKSSFDESSLTGKTVIVIDDVPLIEDPAPETLDIAIMAVSLPSFTVSAVGLNVAVPVVAPAEIVIFDILS